jgi:predicted PurR-regulated permease PerM
MGDDGISAEWNTQRVARTVLIIAVVGVGVWMLRHFLPALAWAAVLAIATWPLRARLARQGIGETTIALVLTLIVGIVLVLPLIGIAVEGAREGGGLMRWVHELRQNGIGTPDWVSQLPFVGNSAAAWWQTNLADPEAARALFGRAESGGVVAFTRAFGIQLLSRLTILVFTLLALFFLYRDAHGVIEEAQAIAERLFGPPLRRLGKDTVEAVRGTVNGLVLVGLAEGVLLGIAYLLAGLPHPVLLGLATAVLATVPFGAPLVFVGGSLLLFVQSQTTAAIALLVFGSVLVFVADHFVRPVLIGSSTRLPFFWVLLSIFGGLETFGLIGLFLGPAIMSILMTMWREGAEKEEISRRIPGASP